MFLPNIFVLLCLIFPTRAGKAIISDCYTLTNTLTQQRLEARIHKMHEKLPNLSE